MAHTIGDKENDMPIARDVVVATIIMATLASPTSAIASPSVSPSASPLSPIASTPSAVTAVHRAVFRMTLARFVALADSPDRDHRLDWSTDGCSAPVVGGSGRSFDFTGPCRRHDFAYRNYKALDNGSWWTPRMRHRIDRVFHRDMLGDCQRRGGTTRRMCRAWAGTFYRAVRTYAGP